MNLQHVACGMICCYICTKHRSSFDQNQFAPKFKIRLQFPALALVSLAASSRLASGMLLTKGGTSESDSGAGHGHVVPSMEPRSTSSRHTDAL
jgi:hypothetical protein